MATPKRSPLIETEFCDNATQALPVSYEITVEETPPNVESSFPPLPGPVSRNQLYYSTVMALTLAILGSSVLPMSYAFAKTGVLLGLIVALVRNAFAALRVVALANTYTCGLLLAAAQRTGKYTYEELTRHVGGAPFMVFTQWSNLILLFGNLTGDMCLLADLGSKSLHHILGDDAPRILVSHEGRGIMILLTCTVIFPLSMLRGMRSLEYVSSAGVGLLLVLTTIITRDAVSSGFRGITSGDVPLWTIDLSNKHIPEAFALIGFSFYLHPLMMPLLQELPAGKEGITVAWNSVKAVIMGIALIGYSYIGIMGAAAFGAKTEGDIMMNRLVSNRTGAAVLVVAVLVYISSCIPPLILSMRCYVDFMIAGPHAGFVAPRFFLETVCIVFLPMFVAMFDAGASRAAFAITGASGVCIVCYIIPVIVHAILRQEERQAGRSDTGAGAREGGETTARLLPAEAGNGLRRAPSAFSFMEDVLPWVVLVMGCAFSGLALKGVIFGL